MSPKYSLNKANLEDAALFVIYAMVGAGFAALAQEAAKFNFGQYTPIVIGVFSVVSMLFHKWATGPRQEAATAEQAVEAVDPVMEAASGTPVAPQVPVAQ